MTKSLSIQNVLLFIAICFTALAIILFINNPFHVSASVSQGSEYHATTTGNGVGFPPASYSYTSCNSTVGSIIFTSPTLSRVQIYDATTSDPSLRLSKLASSTVLIADFPIGTGTSTTVLDTTLLYGLTVVFNGTISTSTITCR